MNALTSRTGARSRTHLVRATLVASLLAASSGCGDATGPGASPCAPSAPRGTMTAQVNGATFTANALTLATIQNNATPGQNTLSVHGMACVSGSANTDKILILLQRQTPFTVGTYQLSADAQGQPAGSGYSSSALYTTVTGGAWYSFGSDASGPASGSITFTTITATRLAGTFSLALVASSLNQGANSGRVTITNGTFDIPK